MLKIAKEQKGFVSEVVFCSSSSITDAKLTYYSSECEVDFCGHGTIATMCELIKNEPSLLHKDEIIIETNRKGKLTIFNNILSENAVYITAPKAAWLDIPITKQEVANSLGICESEISNRYHLDFIDAGLRTLIVPIEHFNVAISLFPDQITLKGLCNHFKIDIILIFNLDTADNNFIAHTRVFAPKFGYLEDPATGSGNSAFGNYMIKNGLWDGSCVSIEQGGNDILYNEVKLKTHNGNILFGGNCALKIEGMYYL